MNATKSSIYPDPRLAHALEKSRAFNSAIEKFMTSQHIKRNSDAYCRLDRELRRIASKYLRLTPRTLRSMRKAADEIKKLDRRDIANARLAIRLGSELPNAPRYKFDPSNEYREIRLPAPIPLISKGKLLTTLIAEVLNSCSKTAALSPRLKRVEAGGYSGATVLDGPFVQLIFEISRAVGIRRASRSTIGNLIYKLRRPH